MCFFKLMSVTNLFVGQQQGGYQQNYQQQQNYG